MHVKLNNDGVHSFVLHVLPSPTLTPILHLEAQAVIRCTAKDEHTKLNSVLTAQCVSLESGNIQRLSPSSPSGLSDDSTL